MLAVDIEKRASQLVALAYRVRPEWAAREQRLQENGHVGIARAERADTASEPIGRRPIDDRQPIVLRSVQDVRRGEIAVNEDGRRLQGEAERRQGNAVIVRKPQSIV